MLTDLMNGEYNQVKDAGNKTYAANANGITISKDVLTIPKSIQINSTEFIVNDGVNPPVTTIWGTLAAKSSYLEAVVAPPNATTLKINETLLCDAGIANQTTSVTDGNITITGTGLNNNPLLSLNTGTGNGILYQEVYNQRTATNGVFSQNTFYAKNSAGGKAEYARITGGASNVGANRGQLDLAVAGASGVVSSYISLNGNNQRIDALRNISMNNQSITSCSTIETAVGNFYSKQVTPVTLSAHTSISTTAENTARYNAFNNGRVPTWEQATISDFNGSVENVSASANFNSAWVVGTTAGNVYYTYDGGSTWTLLYSFGGRINCFQTYNSGSYLAVGGQFTGSYNYIATIDTSWGVNDITGGSTGFNNEVTCFCENTTHSKLYIGGYFTDVFGNSGSFYEFVAYDWSTITFYPINNTGGTGFTGGGVQSIAFGNSNSYDFVVVGGDFTDENTSGSPIGIPYLFTFNTLDGYSVNGYFSVGFPLNSVVSSVLYYSSSFLVGGQFNNSQGQGSCNTNYGMTITWMGASWDLSDYQLYTPNNPISRIQYTNGIYYTIENGVLIYSGSTQLPPIPTGSIWECIAFDGATSRFSTNNQTSVGFLFYDLNNSLVIVVNSPSYPIYTYSGNYTNINLLGFGSAVECMYFNGAWWVVSQIGCNFS